MTDCKGKLNLQCVVYVTQNVWLPVVKVRFQPLIQNTTFASLRLATQYIFINSSVARASGHDECRKSKLYRQDLTMHI